MRLKDIKNGDPVFTGGFHTDVMAVLCEKPVAHRAAISELVVVKTFVL